jgi:hypothetical protein
MWKKEETTKINTKIIIKDRIEEIKKYNFNYPPGWHIGEGVAFSNSTITTASYIVNFCLEVGFYYDTIGHYPGLGGNIAIVLYSEGSSFSLELDVDADDYIHVWEAYDWPDRSKRVKWEHSSIEYLTLNEAKILIKLVKTSWDKKEMYLCQQQLD